MAVSKHLPLMRSQRTDKVLTRHPRPGGAGDNMPTIRLQTQHLAPKPSPSGPGAGRQPSSPQVRILLGRVAKLRTVGAKHPI